MIELKSGHHDYIVQLDHYRMSFECDYKSESRSMIVFIHGLACCRDSFRNVFDRRYFHDETLVLVDLIGFGKSEHPEDFSYSMEDQAKICEQLLNCLPPLPLHLVAHSMGNAVALLLSWNRLRPLNTFANVEGNLIREDCGMMSRSVATVPFDDYRESIFPNSVADFSGHPQLRFEQTTPRAVYYSAESLVQWSDSGKLLERFNRLTCRKCYFWGEQNRNMPVLKHLGEIRTVMIHGAGHNMMTENPDEFYPELACFIHH